MITIDRHYYDGGWQRPSSPDTLVVLSSATEQPIGRAPLGTVADVDRAVQAARRAFDGPWRDTTVAERAAWLERLAAALAPHVPAIAETVAHEVGTAIGFATKVQAQFPLRLLRMHAGWALGLPLERELGHSLVVREPYGVVGAITPWNYPLHQVVCKIAPALVAGCTVVLKPSEVAPLTAGILATAAHEIGLPAGVLNIVLGTGPVIGEAIATHPLVDMVSFTGSVAAGRRVAALAGDGLKKVCLELGGKSAFVVCGDAPFEAAISAGVNSAMQNSGQTCSAWTRMLVPRARQEAAIALAVQRLAALPCGDPFDPATRLGPLASARQRDRVLGYIATGVAEGARLVTGGGPVDGRSVGYYVAPTIFADVDTRMTIAQEEIFGPVLSILPYDTEEDAVRVANDTVYGLAGGVWAGTPERAMAIARQLRTGQVDVNGGRYNAQAPFGGYKHSGIGREMGPFAIEEYLQLKAIQR